MSKYISQFKSLEGETYYLTIAKDPNDPDVREVTLSDDPITITYEVPDRLFSPIRTSNCTIRMLLPDYPLDLYTDNYDTIITIEKDSMIVGARSMVWQGYLDPCVYDQGYSEPIEELELNGSDFLSALKYKEFKKTGKGTITTFKSLLMQICDSCPTINGFDIITEKSYTTNDLPVGIRRQVYDIDYLSVSEGNFFSTEDEPWKLSEVLEEICKYLGMYAVQDSLFISLIDPLAYDSEGKATGKKYLKSKGYATPEKTGTFGGKRTLSKDSYREGGGTMSLMSTMNRVAVKDNFFNVEKVLPPLLNDDALVNTMGDWASYKVIKNTEMEVGDGEIYYRLFRNKNWNYKWYQKNYVKNPTTVPEDSPDRQDYKIMRDYCGAQITDQAFLPYDMDGPQDTSFTRYLCLAPHGYQGGEFTENNSPVLLTADKIPPMVVEPNTYLVISFQAMVSMYDSIAALPPWTKMSRDEAKKQTGIKFNAYSAGSKEGEMVLAPIFKLRVGNRWYENDLLTGSPKWVDHETTFPIYTKPLDADSWFQNGSSPLTTPNALFLGAEGFLIKLPEDLTELNDIEFSICQPLQWFDEKWQLDKWNMTCGCPYMWISSFDMQLRKQNQAIEKDEDELTENILDESNKVLDGEEIELKLTTSNDRIFSLSTVGARNLNGKIYPLDRMTEPKFGTAQKPEENIVQSYVEQYSTPTVREEITIGINYPLNGIINDPYWNKDFYVVGTQIDLGHDSQTITLEEKK